MENAPAGTLFPPHPKAHNKIPIIVKIDFIISVKITQDILCKTERKCFNFCFVGFCLLLSAVRSGTQIGVSDDFIPLFPVSGGFFSSVSVFFSVSVFSHLLIWEILWEFFWVVGNYIFQSVF